MKTLSRALVSSCLIALLLSNALPCGPGYVSPVFERSNAPESPYSQYAAGRLGIVKPGFRRSLLFVAYRYFSGGSFSGADQRQLVELWRSEIDRSYEPQDDISDTVKAWVEKRKTVADKDEKTPDIYIERSYGGYDFFPNCTKNAFEVAAATMDARVASYGATDQYVREWLSGQDQVFRNCSSGKQVPTDPSPGAPQWLQKDRTYQRGAAEFYSLNYDEAKKIFGEIALDTESPWQETADYLVARTLIRQASLTKDSEKAGKYYDEAEIQLQRFISRSGEFTASSERLEGLVRYRRHPKERVGELARKLSFQPGNDNFKQDLIDYTWLLDKFESEAMMSELTRKEREEWLRNGGDDDAVIRQRVFANLAKVGISVDVKVEAGVVTLSGQVDREKMSVAITAAQDAKPRKVENLMSAYAPAPESEIGRLKMNLYSEDYSENWTFYLELDATDEDAIAEAERVVGKPLSKALQDRVRSARQSAYSNRFTEHRSTSYEGAYWGEDDLILSAMPAFLMNDDLTDWLFAYQAQGADAYAYASRRFRETGSPLWLVSAISKAQVDSPDLARLMESASGVGRLTPAFETVAFHRARILLDTGKIAEARTLLDDVLNGPGELSVSSRNSFLGLRVRVTEGLDDFLRYSLRKPYAFDFGGDIGTIDDLIAEQKTFYDPEYNKDGRDAYDREVEERFENERLWEDRLMFDSGTIDLMNQKFPLALLFEVERSPSLPDYLRSRFAIAIWTRAYLAADLPTLLKITPDLARYHPEFADQLKAITEARSPAARNNAMLFFVLKNPLLSPFIEDGMGKSDNEYGEWDANDWWCSSYLDYVDESRPKIAAPGFLTEAQIQKAGAERKQLVTLGDAPELLGKRVFEWAARYPTDRRIPEALFIVYKANGWNKYGCGGNEEIRKQAEDLLKRRYPSSEWTQKLDQPEDDAE